VDKRIVPEGPWSLKPGGSSCRPTCHGSARCDQTRSAGLLRKVRAIHQRCGSVDKGSLSRAEPDNRFCDFLRFPQSAPRVKGDDRVTQRGIRVQRREHRGVDEGRADRVDPQSPARVLQRGGLGQTEDGVLGCDIGRGVAEAHQAEHRRHVDDRPAPL